MPYSSHDMACFHILSCLAFITLKHKYCCLHFTNEEAKLIFREIKWPYIPGTIRGIGSDHEIKPKRKHYGLNYDTAPPSERICWSLHIYRIHQREVIRSSAFTKRQKARRRQEFEHKYPEKEDSVKTPKERGLEQMPASQPALQSGRSQTSCLQNVEMILFLLLKPPSAGSFVAAAAAS